MKRRSQVTFSNYNIKAICGKKCEKQKVLYLVQYEEEDRKNEYISKELLTFGPINHMIEEYDKRLSTAEPDKEIIIDMPKIACKDEIIEIKIEENDKLPKDKNKKKNKKLKTHCPSNNNDVSKEKHVYKGRIVYDPIKINGKEITITDILKWTKKYNRFNDFTSYTLKKVFARNYEICYNDIMDYKFYGITNVNEVIVFTRNQVTLEAFFLPAYNFLKKFPLAKDEPPC
ncbi:Hypothetical protein SRAE_2000276000 [Strongyloides ratti]|uniref:Uncharacterized protein n=1 Tax=Strongyloides ratti TaxID=34506 RepID=A0A090LEC8_STRRB|nr:Hypothetical protein SRAE_2000276000 [Strongyloides ratti]CEF68102.1 Hypothetical protein SRAE_2000276000 [Strongyloides ratti]